MVPSLKVWWGDRGGGGGGTTDKYMCSHHQMASLLLFTKTIRINRPAACRDHHRPFLRGGALPGRKTTVKRRKISRNKALTGYWTREVSPRSGSIPKANVSEYEPNSSRVEVYV